MINKITKSKNRDEIHQPVTIKTVVRENGTRRVSQSFKNVESLTEKSDMPLTSIRNLLKRGFDVHDGADDQQFIDLTQFSDFQEQMERVASAHDSFEQLPARLRERFRNDPAEMINFVQNPNNTNECIQLGLIPQPKPTPGGDNPDSKTPSPVNNTDNSPDSNNSNNSNNSKKDQIKEKA